MILGIDEVGRGPWAGPLVVGAVVLGCEIDGLTDSKKLSAKRRGELNREIVEKAAAVGLGWVSAEEIDQIGLSESLRLATKRAVQQINTPFHEIIIDGTINFLADTPLGGYVTTLKKADLLIPSVSAASIVAKVARDDFMKSQDEVFSDYDFGSHVGYGTAKHRAAIERYGITPLHRLSFAPIAKFAESSANVSSKTSIPQASGTRPVTTKQIGDEAEELAAEYLRGEGHEILDRNWKTKYCEIDIVSRKVETIYFVEVKHRKNSSSGDGIAAITAKKLHKMKFAASIYIKANHLEGHDVRLAVVSTKGQPPAFERYLELKD